MKNNRLLVLSEINLSRIKTKDFVQLMSGLEVDRALIVTEGVQLNLKLSARNLKEFKVIPLEGLNIYDLLLFDILILTRGVFPELERILN